MAALKTLTCSNSFFICSFLLITPGLGILVLPASIFATKLVANVPRNLPLYSFSLFLIFFITPFINKPYFSRDMIVFMSSISSLKIINSVTPDAIIFLYIPASAAIVHELEPEKKIGVFGSGEWYLALDII